MKKICIYLGATFGNNELFKKKVIELGKKIAELKLSLVYGGSSLGMMGLLANTVLDHGSSVTGIITKHLIDKEVPIEELNELIIVDSMQERKKAMQEMSDAFLIMPGGLGTLEEAFETWNSVKTGEHTKPISFYNIGNYFNKLISFMEECQTAGFLKNEHLNIPFVSDDIEKILDHLIQPI